MHNHIQHDKGYKIFCLNERLQMSNHNTMASTSDSVLNPYGPRREKTCLWRFVNNKGADQPAHPCRLIRAFIIHLLENIISLLAPSEISLFWLVSVAKETGLILAFSESPKTGFLALRPLCEQPWLKQACTFYAVSPVPSLLAYKRGM